MQIAGNLIRILKFGVVIELSNIVITTTKIIVFIHDKSVVMNKDNI